MNIVLFNSSEIQVPLATRDERAQHIIKILHKKEGDSFEAGIINGVSGSARITSLSKEFIYFHFTAHSGTQQEGTLYPIQMIIGFPRPIQLKRLLRDASSLGVAVIHLSATENGEKSYMQSTLLERGAAEHSLIEGASQAKNTHIPSIHMHSTLTECIQTLQAAHKFDSAQRIVFDVTAESSRIEHLRMPEEDTYLYAAIGSERGWSTSERTMLRNAGFISHSLGNRILRTETAVTASIAIMLYRLGLM